MKELPEDGCLEKITAPALNPDNVIIIRRFDEFKEPGETTYTFATCDRTKEGVEWPGDKYLEKLIPELPKVKVPEVSKPEEITKTNTQYRHNIKRKYYKKPMQRYTFASRRSRPPYKKSYRHRSENLPYIEPWVHKPWENSIFQSVNTTSMNTSLISNAPFNNSCIQNNLPPHFARNSSNNYNLPNNNEINMINAASNSPFLNNHIEALNRPIRMPNDHFSQPSNRFPNLHPSERFSGPGPSQNMNINNSNHKTDLCGETPVSRYNLKQGLLGYSPLFPVPFNGNLATFPNNISAQSDAAGINATLHSGDQKIIDNRNNSLNNGYSRNDTDQYDAGYSRNLRHNFDQYNDGNEIYGNKLNNFDKYPSKNSRGTYRQKFGRMPRKRPGRINHSKTGFIEAGNDKLHENNYNKSQVNNVSKTSPFMNNQGRNSAEDSLVHISNSAVVYNPEAFQNDGYPTTATNSAPSSNVNSMSRSNIRQNSQTKNTFRPRKHCNTNNRLNRVNYNQGQQKFRN